jgi:hypothetical protein
MSFRVTARPGLGPLRFNYGTRGPDLGDAQAQAGPPVCAVGILDGYAAGRASCGYARCGAPAAAKAPRVRLVCRAHLNRPKVRDHGGAVVPLGRLIAEQAGRVRATGRPVPGWPGRFVWTADPPPTSAVGGAR